MAVRLGASFCGGAGRGGGVSPVLSLARPRQVDIRFPPPGSDEPDKVTVMGLPDTVDNAVDHLLNLEEEYVSSHPFKADLWGWFLFFFNYLIVSNLFSSALRCST